MNLSELLLKIKGIFIENIVLVSRHNGVQININVRNLNDIFDYAKISRFNFDGWSLNSKDLYLYYDGLDEWTKVAVCVEKLGEIVDYNGQ